MRNVSLIDEEDVIERILHHLGLWQEGVRVHSGTDSPGETTLDPWLDHPFPTEPVIAFSRQRPSSVPLAPLFSGPQPSGPCLTSAPIFVTLRPWKRTLSASDSRPTLRRAKSDFLSVYARLLASSVNKDIRVVLRGFSQRLRRSQELINS
jgi:hypothetical protein